jgi:hypothetical protein
MMSRRGSWISILVLAAATAMADEPLAPASVITRCSPSGRYCATADPKLETVVVYEKGQATAPRWSLKGWQRVFDVADSGEHLVTCYSGMNLLPLDYKPEWNMLAFYERGKLIRTVSVAELIPDLTKLRRTASHYEWGQCMGFDGPNRYRVTTVDRGLLHFDVTTGLPTK